MSQLYSNARQLSYNIRSFKGVNENADGDTNIAPGEAAMMRNYRVTDGGALKVRPGYKKAIPEFEPSNAIHEGFEAQITSVYASGQEISFYEHAAVEDNTVVLSDEIATLDMRSSEDRAALRAYAECFFTLDGKPYKYTKATSAVGVSGATVCYVYGKALSVDKGITGLWSGTVAGQEVMLFARDNTLYSQQFDTDGEATATAEIGTIDTSSHVEIFFFGDKVYVLDGVNYFSFDGTTFKPVEGYIPTVAVAVSPSGDGTLLEPLNTLIDKFRIKFSSNGTATTYKFDSGFKNTLAREVFVGGVKLDDTEYDADFDGSVTFDTAPASGQDNIEVIYAYIVDSYQNAVFDGLSASAAGKQFKVENTGETSGISSVKISRSGSYVTLTEGADYLVGRSGEDFTVTLNVALLANDSVIIGRKLIRNRNRVVSMRYAELYNGASDTRVFLYGDGSNKAIYSDITSAGIGSAEYFPDLNEMRIGDANTPISAMIRHHNRLLAFKKGGSAYSVYYGQLSLADGSITAGFYISNVNKSIGCDRYDGAVLVMNSPRTVEKGAIYEWRASSTSGNITLDQRNAKLVSEKVQDTLKSFDMENAMCFFDLRRHEYYCVYDGTAVVNNTENGAWYIYTNFPATSMTEYGGRLYFGTADGLICRVDEALTTDDGEMIRAEWESGSLDFGKAEMLKYSPCLWLSALPEDNAEIMAGISTDRGEESYEMLPFAPKSGMAKTVRARLKARKFSYYKLRFVSFERGRHAAILSATVKANYDVAVRS